MKYLAVVMLALSYLAGCSSTYERTRAAGGTSTPVISSATSVYVGMPKNGQYGNTIYQGSGAMTAQAVYEAFIARVKRVEMSKKVQGRDAALEQAKKLGFAYYAEPEILHWEDRATEWSGKSDKISVLISILDVSSGKQIDRTIIKGTSKWATFGGDHPQDLLTEPINQYVAELVK